MEKASLSILFLTLWSLSAAGPAQTSLVRGHRSQSSTQNQEKLEYASLIWQVGSPYSDRVAFNLTVDSEAVKSYDWYGVALESTQSEIPVANADFAVLVFETCSLVSMSASDHHLRRAQNSYKLKDVHCSKLNGQLSVTWNRYLKEQDYSGSALEEDKDYTLVFAYGKNPDSESYSVSSYGYRSIHLSNSFSGKVSETTGSSLTSLGSGTAALKYAELKWTVSSTKVDFNLTVDPIVVFSYNFYTVGLKIPGGTFTENNTDYAVVSWDSSGVHLLQMNSFGKAINATKHPDLKNITSKRSGGLWMAWSKELNSANNETLRLIEGGQYTLTFAYGLNEQTQQSNTGSAEISLSNNFYILATFSYGEVWGYQATEKGNLYWRVPDSTNGQPPGTVTFHLKLDQSAVSDYDWYQVGFKGPSGESSIKYADIAAVRFKELNVILKNTFNSDSPQDSKNQIPFSDSIVGFNTDGTLSAIWNRKLNEISNETVRFISGDIYSLVYGYGHGKVDSSNSEYTRIILENGFFNSKTQEDSASVVLELLGVVLTQVLF
mmetsp:Transcript_7206/g.10652  ORF Transcript_7206/g.10652 Transcript_7206/m.10652 type:complete len:548 (+) Transcript_7206:6-1649(+)